MQTLIKYATKFIVLIGLALLVFNCSKDANALIENQQIEASELKTILETDDISGAADTIIAGVFSSGTTGKSAKLEDCHITEFSDTGFDVTFDNCVYEGGEMITGNISITYTEGQENTFVATYTDLMVGDYEINGTRGFTIDGDNLSGFTFTITSDMTIKLKDGSIIEETGAKVLGFVFDFDNLENNGVTIDGDWTVIADGNTYVVNIASLLEITGACNYVGKGVMQLNKNGLKVDIDFGDGTCDDIATLTYPDGTNEEISLKD